VRYTVRNPKTGETITVDVLTEIEETELRNFIAIFGWEILATE
jgi:hypothetical protein